MISIVKQNETKQIIWHDSSKKRQIMSNIVELFRIIIWFRSDKSYEKKKYSDFYLLMSTTDEIV